MDDQIIMPNNTINISFDYLKLQGARKVTKEGRDYILIDIAASRAKPFKRQNGEESVYGSLDIKANKNGEDQHGKTHFVAEATTKEERAAKTLLPIIGNGKEFVFNNSGSGSRQQNAPTRQQAFVEPEDDSSIPF